MVQLEAACIASARTRTSVLIPIWCNWKKDSFYETLKEGMVLIPIWCNWKEADKARLRSSAL
ncbi:hypothetical protein, partial [Porphyromonas loveana]|uniref:hypothetical protein n=1 Tax=Porphyromonas loveana TaxID=1884669 RepID=UPI004039BF25